MGEINATSADDPWTGKQASVRLEGSDTWQPALVPVHAPRGSRTPSKGLMPVVGCLVDNRTRFVLSWADMRCRSTSSVDVYSFPAECDGGSQRNVMINDTEAAKLFVKNLKQEERRKLLGDTDNTFIKGKKTAIVVLISPSDATTAAEPWSDVAALHGSPNAYVDAVVRRCTRRCTVPVTACAQPSAFPTPHQRPRPRRWRRSTRRCTVGRGARPSSTGPRLAPSRYVGILTPPNCRPCTQTTPEP